jgi:hypothetical protein
VPKVTGAGTYRLGQSITNDHRDHQLLGTVSRAKLRTIKVEPPRVL